MTLGTPTRLSGATGPCLVGEHVNEATSPATRRGRSLTAAVAIGIGAVIIFEVRAFGARDESAIFGIEANAAVLLMLWAVGAIVSERFEVVRNPLLLPVGSFAVPVAVQLLPHQSSNWYATWQNRVGTRDIELRRRSPRVSLRIAALTGYSGLLIHNLSDFDLQLPANALLFFALAAIAAHRSGGRATSIS